MLAGTPFRRVRRSPAARPNPRVATLLLALIHASQPCPHPVRISRLGGGWRLHMLRRLLGDAAFWSGVQSYVSAHQQQTVETDDFRKHLERASGRNLTRFFDQWFYGRGFPKLRGTLNDPPAHPHPQTLPHFTIKPNPTPSPTAPTPPRRTARPPLPRPLMLTGEFKFSAERGEAVLTLEQTQAADHTLFTIDVEALITYSLPATGGAAAQRASVLVTVPLGARGVRKETAVVRLPAGAKPVALQVDPEHKVLFTLDMNPGACVGSPRLLPRS